MAQLFYDTGAGYNEANSRIAPVLPTSTNHGQRLVFDLPRARIYHLRFDPLMTEGTVTLRHVAIVGAKETVMTIAPSDIVPFNQIGSRVEREREVTFSTRPGANDPGLTFILHKPFEYKRERASVRGAPIVIGNVAIAAAVFLLLFARGVTARLAGAARDLLRQAHSACHHIALSLSATDFIQFDAWAIWFYILCLTAFLIAVIADFNGSSADIYSAIAQVQATPLFGSPRLVRGDEWSFATPATLNESLRWDRFEAKHSYLGDHSIALLADLPVRHVSTVFRPQFWPFFVLPVDYAYGAFWQFKALILITGSFTFLLLLTRSTFWALCGSLWYFFSPFTQWTYSWPSALPEMVGLICMAIVLACFLTIARNLIAILIAALGLATCAIDFTMCGYPPHIIPLLLLAVFFFISWCSAQRKLIFRREMSGRRVLGFSIALALIGVIGFAVYLDTREAIRGVASTIYPGQRVFSGANTTIQMLTSHFLQWTETETHFPPALTNICEASGFLWLAPATLFCLGSVGLSRIQKFGLASLWCFLAVLLTWMIVPIPSSAGRILGLNETGWTRCLPALGLTNISIVALTMSAASSDRAKSETRAFSSGFLLRTSGVFLIVFTILLLTNQSLASYFSWKELAFDICFTTLLIMLVLERRRVALAIALITSQALVFGAINPIERGLPVFTSSALYGFVRSHSAVLKGKWLVFSDGIEGSSYLAAMGCDVYTGLKYLPDIDHFALFASKGLDTKDFNRDGLLVARVAPPNRPSFTEVPHPFMVRWNVNPSDPILRTLGIQYIAFDQKPSDAIASQLVPLANESLSSLWLYRLP